MIDFDSLFSWSKDTELNVPVTSDTVLPGENGTFHVLVGKSMRVVSRISDDGRDGLLSDTVRMWCLEAEWLNFFFVSF